MFGEFSFLFGGFMRSNDIPATEMDNLISWCRTEDFLVGSLQNLYFNMTYAGCYVCRKTFSIHRKNNESILLLLTVDGEGKLQYQEKDYRLTPGSVMLINAQNLHKYQAVDDGWTFKYLHFRGAMSDEYQAYIDTKFGPVFHLHKKIYMETEERLDAVFRETEKTGIPDYASVSSNIYAILTSFLSPKNAISSTQKAAAAIQQAAAYIAENYNRNIVTQDIADAVYLSRCYMSEQFTKTYGVSPHEYLTMYRLSYVKENLLNTSASVSEIAERTGFRDVFTLSRVFKQKFGVSPSEYRKRILD